MNNTNTGGPAFPGPYANENGSIEALFKQQGMTLRDYFAASALQGAIAHGLFNADKAHESYAQYLSYVAYVYADAMLKARQA